MIGLFVMVGGAAWGQSITGGCTATVNGRTPQSLTEGNPLIVSKDESVTLSGSVPPSVASAPKKQIKSTTDVYVDVFGFPVKVRTANGTGPTWGGSVQLPKVIRDLATGVYRVSGDATGSPGGWSCSGSGYIKLDGSALTKPATYIGAGIGAAGGAAALGGKKPGKGKKNAGGQSLVDLIKEMGKDLKADFGADTAMLIALLLIWFLFLKVGLLGIVIPTMALGAAGGKDRTWLPGRPLRGFFGGLFLGLGVAVVAQQFGVGALDRSALWSVLATALLMAIRAWRGTPLTNQGVAAAPPPPAEA